MRDSSYIQALKRVLVAYVFLFFDFNVSTMDILPNWVAYCLFYQTITPIAKYERSADLLKPLIIGLGIFSFVEWGYTITGQKFDFYLVYILITSASLYFHYQYITNISDIAELNKYDNVKLIRKLRDLRTIFITLGVLPFNWKHNEMISIVFVLCSLAVQLMFIVTMVRYKNFEEKN